MNDMLYPVTVFTSRYGGIYEGAPWIAVQTHADPNMCGRSDEPDLKGVQGDDIVCSDWFADASATPIGRGDTPDLAVADLAEQLGINWAPGDDSPQARWAKALKNANEQKEENL